MSPGVPTPHPRTGALLSLASALLAAAFLIPYKLAGARAPADLVTLAMLASAAMFNTATTLGSRLGRPAQAAPSWRLAFLVAAGIAVLTATGNFAVAQALTHSAPGLVSSVQQTQVIFVAAASAVLLGERITLRFGAGVLVALAGFAVMRLPMDEVVGGAGGAGPAAGATGVVEIGVLWAVLSALCFGLMHVITRKVIRRIDPMFVNALRLWLAVGLMVMLPGRLAGALALDLHTWALAAAAACLGPFLSRLCLMYAVRHISASRSSLITLAAPVFAFVLGFLVLGIAPTVRELLGGAFIAAGIALPLLERVAAATLSPRDDLPAPLGDHLAMPEAITDGIAEASQEAAPEASPEAIPKAIPKAIKDRR
jgi:drug/metabolite transporter (DMT)-like permease